MRPIIIGRTFCLRPGQAAAGSTTEKVKVRIALSLDSEAAKKMLDADIVVKLIDLRPDGYQMLVRGDVMPLRFREGFQMPKPVKAGKKTIVEFTMCDIDHRFMEGHTLMVQVQGSWFPLIALIPSLICQRIHFCPRFFRNLPPGIARYEIFVRHRRITTKIQRRKCADPGVQLPPR